MISIIVDVNNNFVVVGEIAAVNFMKTAIISLL